MYSTLKKFIGIVKDTYGECTLYGLYRGSYNHVGVAIKCDSAHEYLSLCLDLAENGLEDLARENTHKDSLGLGLVYSWPLRLFEMEEEEISKYLLENTKDSYYTEAEEEDYD
jgi:hypothetical protein